MIEILFQTIPRGLNEIFAVGAVLAAILYVFDRKQDKHRAIFLWLAILFMLFWRLAAGIISSRYTAILIYPAVILSAYVCVRIAEQLRRLPKTPERLIRVFPWLALSGISIACLTLSFHSNPYANHFWSSYQVIRQEKEENESLIVWGDNDARRSEYYTGVPHVYMPSMGQSPWIDKLPQFYKANAVLLLNMQQQTEPDFLTEIRNKLPPDAEFDLIFSRYTNRRKKRKHNIYRYVPPSRAKAVPALSDDNGNGKNLLIDGGVEEVLTPEQTRRRIPEQVRHIDFFHNDPFVFPLRGYFLPSGSNKDEKTVPFFCSVEDGALAGKRSILLRAGKDGVYFLFYQRFSQGKYRFSVYGKGREGTVVHLLFDAMRNKKWNVVNVCDFTLPDGQLYHFSAAFDSGTLKDDEFFLVGVWVQNGEIRMDQFLLNLIDPTKQAEKTE